MASAGTPAQRGAFIVFEGVDRCGKTTQSKLLAEHLQRQKIKVERWSFPDRTTSVGSCINAYLQDKTIKLDPVAAHYLFVANRHEKRTQLVAALQSGTTVIVDRYSYSGIAYSCAKGLPSLSPAGCAAMEAGLPAPDVVMYMRLSSEATRQREGYGEERYEDPEMQAKVVVRFEALEDGSWNSLDATQSIDAIHRQVVACAERVLEECKGRPIARLWDRQPYVELADATGTSGSAANSAEVAAAPAAIPCTNPAPASTFVLQRVSEDQSIGDKCRDPELADSKQPLYDSTNLTTSPPHASRKPCSSVAAPPSGPAVVRSTSHGV